MATGRDTRDWQTQRRLQAVALYKKGWQQKIIAEALGVTKGAISQWVKKAQAVMDASLEERARVLAVKKSTGRPPALSAEQCQQLVVLVERGAEAFGFVGAVWTAKRVQVVVRRELNVRVGLTTINKALHQEGFSVQKPQVQATQKRAAQVAGFRGGWANLKKGQSQSEQP